MTIATWIEQGVPDISEASEFETYRDSAGDVVRLSREDIIGFSLFPEDASVEVTEHYRTSIDRFPTVQSCLIESERRSLEPDLVKVNWKSFRGVSDAIVCLFRVQTSYQTVADVAAWYESQEFGAHVDAVKRTGADPHWGVSIQGYWSIKRNGWLFRIDHGSLVGNWIIKRIFPPHYLYFTSIFDPIDGLYYINIVYPYK